MKRAFIIVIMTMLSSWQFGALIIAIFYFPKSFGTNILEIPDTVLMKEKTDTLREVVVLSNAVKSDAEGYSVNMAAISELQGMNLEEALAFLPGMEVAGERIKVYSKDVARVYVNRRQVRLTGEALMSYLRSFDVRNIKEVRVVEAAGADVNATEAGMAIVRITTRRMDDGGQLTLGGTTYQTIGLYTYGLPTANLQVRYGRWSVYGNGNYTFSHSEIDAENNNSFLSSGLQTSIRQTTTNDPKNGDATFGIGYDLGKNDYLTAEVYYTHNTLESSLAEQTTVIASGGAESAYRNIGSNDSRTNAGRGTVDYTHLWGKGHLTLSATDYQYHVKSAGENQRENHPALWSTASATDTRRRHWEVQADGEQKLPGKWGALKAGLLASFWRNEDDTRNRLTQNGADVPFATFTDLYTYCEQDYAAYASWQFQYRTFSGTVGLRYEHRTIDPRSMVASERNQRSHYDHLYPNIQFGYLINPLKGHSLRLSYARGVIMPMLPMLNPTVHWQSEYQYSMGNPFLQPATSEYISGTLTLWHGYWVSLSWGRNSMFRQVYFEADMPDLYYSSYVNGESVHTLRMAAGATKRFAKRLMLNGSLDYFRQTSSYQNLGQTGNQFHASIAATYILPHDVNVRLGGMYDSPCEQLTYHSGEHWQLSVRLTKQLFRRSLTLTLNYICIPRTTNSIETGSVQSSQQSQLSPHRVGLSVRYMLQWGKQVLKIRRSSGASEESRRGG